MSKLQIVGLGLATLDVLLRLDEMPTWQSGTRMKAFALDGGGPAATAMVAAAKLGARVGYVGTAGNDEAARIKVRSLNEAGVDTSRLVWRDEPERHVIVVCVDAQSGDRVFSGLEGLHEHELCEEELDRDYIISADYLHLDGVHGGAALTAARWMKAAGKTVVFDGAKTTGVPRHHVEGLLECVDILICGSGYAMATTGREDLWESSKALLAMGPRVVVQTEGERGSYTLTASQSFHTPAFEVDVLDTTGAGDVFHGAYITGLLKGWDLRTVATFASAVSALKCSKLGGRAGIPSFEQTLRFLAERDIHIERKDASCR